MTSNNQHPISDQWHFFLRVYARFDKISHHLLSISLKFLAVLLLLFCVIFLVLRFVLIPQVGNYQPEIEQLLSSKLGRPVIMSQVVGSWQGLRPQLELQQVAISDEQGNTALTLPSVQVTVSWLSLLIADLRLYKLEISQPELEIQRDVDGKIYIAGWWIDPEKKSDVSGLNWLLAQRSIVINNGTLKWTDQQHAAPSLTLSQVNFVMRNQWLHHRFSLTATPPTNLAGPLDIRADFKHHPFSENIADFLQWKGNLYADFSKTDLAAWKSYFDYPFEVQRGVGGVRVWFMFDQAKIVNITADLKLTNVNARLAADLQPLDLKSVSGRISAQEITVPTRVIGAGAVKTEPDGFRKSGHQIALTNFTFESQNGLQLPPTTLTEKFVPGNSTTADQFQFSTKFLDLTVLAKLTAYFPLPKNYRDLLNSAAPAGQLANFSVKLQGSYPEFSQYQITGRFNNLAMQSQTVNKHQKSIVPAGFAEAFSLVPGFTNLTGYVNINEKRGSIQLASNDLLLQLSDSFPEPEIKFDQLEMNANWSVQPDEQLLLTLTKFNSTQQETQAHFYGTHIFSTRPDESNPEKTVLDEVLSGTLDLTGTISHIDLSKINRFLPDRMDSDLRHWLTQGLQEGSLNNVSVRVKGNLTDFPFAKEGLLDQDTFHFTGKIVDGKINYLPGVFAKDGVNPYWPILSKINGEIVIDRNSMDIHAESGETDGIAVAKVHARIPDLLSKNVMLEIDGTASGTAQSMLHYISVSPVLEWTDHFTQDSKMTGDAKLKLRLDIPLSHPLDTIVAGEVQLNDNDVALLKELPLLTKVSGRFNFDERGLNLNKLKGNFLGGPVTVVGGTQKDGVIRFKAEGLVSADGLRKSYGQPELKNLLTHIDGKTPFTAVVQVVNKQTEVWVDSTMQGMALRLPAPLNKTAASQMPLRVAVINASKGMPEQDEMKLSLGSVVNAHYFRQRASIADPWIVTRGGIGISAPAPNPESGLSAHIELASLDVDELQALFPDKKTKLTTSASAGHSSSPIDFYQYLEPDTLSIYAAELTLLGKKLNQVVLGATRSNGIWQANIGSQQISGHLTWENADQTKGSMGHVTARLGSLVIPETAANDVVDLLQNEKIHSTIPGLDVVAENVELFGKKLGRLELQAKNVDTKNNDTGNEWQIDALNLSNADAVLTARGKWMNGGDGEGTPTKNQTNLTYQLAIVDAGKLLGRLGYSNLIAGGKGKLNGDVIWNGSPYSMDIPSLSGNIQLDLQAGQFLKVDPGAAKLLAVLNLQSLPRRLILDFRDVFSEGFAFDGITGNAKIEKGIAKTDNFKMRSPAATVLLSGTANITNETQDLHVVVVPEINAGAASVVYGLAVNPVIGVGTFLAQLFLRQPLMKAFTFEYQITGSWKEPAVVKLGSKK